MRDDGESESLPAGSVVYQIFLDRFANGDPGANPSNVAPWGSKPTRREFMGGDLRGVAGKLGYLEELGVDLIFLTPIFLSSSNHRYNTYDYYRIDPRLGTADDLARLLDEAHGRDMRVLLDGVFGHCGRGFYPFFEVMENGADSPYASWFFLHNVPVDAYGRHRYRAFQDSPEVPELDLADPGARDYMLAVAEHWTRQGIDGWRLDAVRHVRHRPFWSALREAVKSINPDALLIAEVWEDLDRWLDCGDFDGVTNYAFRSLVVDFLVRRVMPATEFAARLGQLAAMHSRSPPRTLCNMVGSHDTVRLRTETGGDEQLVKLIYLLLFFFPGVPAIYYGDEVGLAGGSDPDNRAAMEWDPGRWDSDLRAYVQRLIALRRSLPALREGDWRTLLAEDARGLCAFARRAGDREAILVLNGSCWATELALDLRACDLKAVDQLEDCLTGRAVTCGDAVLRLAPMPPKSGILLTRRGLPAT